MWLCSAETADGLAGFGPENTFLTSVFLFNGVQLMLFARAVQDNYPAVSVKPDDAMPAAAGVMVVGLVLRAEPTVVMALLTGRDLDGVEQAFFGVRSGRHTDRSHCGA